MECCDATGVVVFSCMTSASITPVCSDESVSHHLVTTESRLQLTGGMERVFCGTPGRPGPLYKTGYRVFNFMDKGFVKYGWDRRPGLSFTQWADQKQLTHPHFNYFLPSSAGDPVLDANLRPAGRPAVVLTNRLVLFSKIFLLSQTIIFKTDRQANTSRFCTKIRHVIENSFAVLWAQKLSGLHHTIPQQLMGASGSQPTPQLPRICVWLHVINTVIRRNMKPLLSSYAIPPGMSYSDVGRLTLQRLV